MRSWLFLAFLALVYNRLTDFPLSILLSRYAGPHFLTEMCQLKSCGRWKTYVREENGPASHLEVVHLHEGLVGVQSVFDKRGATVADLPRLLHVGPAERQTDTRTRRNTDHKATLIQGGPD